MTASHQAVAPLTVGFKGCCPRCGKGPLYKSLVNIELRPSCSACGLDYKFIDTGDGPAWFAMVILSVAILGGALFVEFRFDPPVWVHVVLWGLLTPLAAIALLRLIKGVLISLQFRNKAEEGRLARDR